MKRHYGSIEVGFNREANCLSVYKSGDGNICDIVPIGRMWHVHSKDEKLYTSNDLESCIKYIREQYFPYYDYLKEEGLLK